MSRVVAEHERVQEAFRQPALTMLRLKNPRLTAVIFRVCFSRDEREMPVARMHLLVDELMQELRAAGVQELPEKTGAKLCSEWVSGEWLNREVSGVYSLTYQAQKALELVDLLTGDRSTLSEHRIATILSTIRRFNTEANPDREERKELYRAQIKELKAKLDHLEAGGEVPAPTPDYMLQGYIEVLDLVAGLSADFTRVQEAFDDIRRQILNEFRDDPRPPGILVANYLERAADLIAATPEGRAFEGALMLLINPVLQEQLGEDMRALLEHPLAGEILSSDDQRSLRLTNRFIQRGFTAVIQQRSQTTEAIKNYVQTHDGDQDRELGRTLKALDGQLAGWLARTGIQTRVEIGLLPEQVELGNLPAGFHDPAADIPPPPLPAVPDTAGLTIEEVADLAVLGGPSLPALQALLAEAVANAEHETLSDLFSTLEVGLRRPVEVLGLHYLADRDGLLVDDGGADFEEFDAVRPDGSTRTFRTRRARLIHRTPQEPS